MGGDGGSIASNRRYLRGAGTADHTADLARHKRSATEIEEANQEKRRHEMTTCAVSGRPLSYRNLSSSDGEQSGIVVCAHGKLYEREAALEALLRRKRLEKQMKKESKKRKQGEGLHSTTDDPSASTIGAHVRGLGDLHSAVFAVERAADSDRASGKSSAEDTTTPCVPICPITGVDLTRFPCILIVATGKREGVNVMSERALKEMDSALLQEEYGPFQQTIRLAPSAEQLAEMRASLEQQRLKEDSEKMQKPSESKKRRKQQHAKDDDRDTGCAPLPLPATQRVAAMSEPSSSSLTSNILQTATSNVAAAMSNDAVLSSIFTKKGPPATEKQARDDLFAR